MTVPLQLEQPETSPAGLLHVHDLGPLTQSELVESAGVKAALAAMASHVLPSSSNRSLRSPDPLASFLLTYPPLSTLQYLKQGPTAALKSSRRFLLAAKLGRYALEQE